MWVVSRPPPYTRVAHHPGAPDLPEDALPDPEADPLPDQGFLELQASCHLPPSKEGGLRGVDSANQGALSLYKGSSFEDSRPCFLQHKVVLHSPMCGKQTVDLTPQEVGDKSAAHYGQVSNVQRQPRVACLTLSRCCLLLVAVEACPP